MEIMKQTLGILFLLVMTWDLTGADCPAKCQCFQANVRCMMQKLDSVPKVPLDTTVLDLRFNKIQELPPGTFKELKNLTTLLLNNNHLTRLQNGALTGLKNLRFLYLYKNRLKEIEPSALRGLPNLEELHLHFNSLTEVLPGTFADFPSLQKIFLQNNQLERISEKAFGKVPSLTHLRLNGNALICDCHLGWLPEFLRRHESSSRVQVSVPCHGPENLRGKSLLSVPKHVFQCEKPPTGEEKPVLNEEPFDIEVNVGEPVSLRCSASGNPSPEIFWMHNSNMILPEEDPHLKVLPDGTLMILETQDEDMGEYECMAKNEKGEMRSRRVRMTAKSSPPPIDNSLIVELPEQEREIQNKSIWFVRRPENEEAIEGEGIQLDCMAKGSPEPTVQWLKDDSPLPRIPKYKVLPSGSLMILEASLEDSGLYNCVAVNNLDRISATAFLRVLSPPKLKRNSEDQVAGGGDTVEFLCLAMGTPAPIVSWSRDATHIVPDDRRTISVGGQVLRIAGVKPMDSGTYTCKVENSVGILEHSSKLIVDGMLPPNIVAPPPQDLEAGMGTDVYLPCQAQGLPTPVVVWKKDGLVMGEDVRHRIVDGSLYVYNLSKDDAGMYECAAQNAIGSVTAQARMKVTDQVDEASEEFLAEKVNEVGENVRVALQQTIADFNQTRLRISDLFHAARFPTNASRALAVAGEIYEQAILVLQEHLLSSRLGHLVSKDFLYEDWLSRRELELLSNLSGCNMHRPMVNCSDMCFHSRYRSFDGTCNNIRHPLWGASLTAFNRILQPVYEDGFNAPKGWFKDRRYHGRDLPSAREVSWKIISTRNVTEDAIHTHMLMQWGQFLDHDLDHALPSISTRAFRSKVPCSQTCTNEPPCFPIAISGDDPRIQNRQCMEFIRSSPSCGSGFTSFFFPSLQPREQINQLTSFIDASQVYGFSEREANSLRNFSTDSGLLRVGLQLPGQEPLLPFSHDSFMDCRRNQSESEIQCFLAGDIRANEQLGLIAMHTLWMREHNRIATQLKGFNSQWNSEKVFQEARKIVGAEMQHITYSHWLPKLLGPKGMEQIGEYSGYNPNVNPSIANAFATAAFRVGHTLINPILMRLDGDFQPILEGHIPLHKAFFSPWRIVEEGGIDPLLRGLFVSPGKQKRSDQLVNSDLTEKLFQQALQVALDLAAMNIQRGRDHGLPGYNDWRRFCNLTVARNFLELRYEIKDETLRTKLEEIYSHPDNVDLWVGGLAEDPLLGGKVGPTITCLIAQQFQRLRDGDRFWYENPGVFKPEQLSQIKQANLARILCDNGDNISHVTRDVFLLPHIQRDGFLPCQSPHIPIVDLHFWDECCPECDEDAEDGRLSRKKRRAPGFSYQEDRPGPEEDEEDVKEMRIEGIESMLFELRKTISKLNKRVRRLESQCQGQVRSKEGPSCNDERGLERKEGEKWKIDKCTKCSCEAGEVRCNAMACPPVKCKVPTYRTDECCPTC